MMEEPSDAGGEVRGAGHRRQEGPGPETVGCGTSPKAAADIAAKPGPTMDSLNPPCLSLLTCKMRIVTGPASGVCEAEASYCVQSLCRAGTQQEC